MNDDRLAEIERRAAAATPGPWFVGYCDDERFKTSVVITTRPFDERTDTMTPLDGPEIGFKHRHAGRWTTDMSDEEVDSIIGCTLLQTGPHFIGTNDADDLWDENANLMAHARQDIPYLLDLVREQRAEIEVLMNSHRITKQRNVHLSRDLQCTKSALESAQRCNSEMINEMAGHLKSIERLRAAISKADLDYLPEFEGPLEGLK